MKTRHLTCAACGWTGSEPEITLSREEVCPSCGSDELEETRPAGLDRRLRGQKPTVAQCRALVELLRKS
jgi:DNA-directed RNA polymerase subunit RPC12/RpoP